MEGAWLLLLVSIVVGVQSREGSDGLEIMRDE
jgi:hypothetical protein